MSQFEDDLQRGCLETGEPLEAACGAGWWTEDPRNPYCPPIVQCPRCGGHAYDLGDTLDCENCGETKTIIYSIGHRKTYLRGLEEGNLLKRGRYDDYPGGYAFRTKENAQRRIDEAYDDTYAVFGLDADWERDTVPSQNGWWHALIVDRPIIALQESGQ